MEEKKTKELTRILLLGVRGEIGGTSIDDKISHTTNKSFPQPATPELGGHLGVLSHSPDK